MKINKRFRCVTDLYQVPVGIIVLFSMFYGTISLLAVIGNSLVIWIIATTKSMQTVTNFFISNLALADVVIGVFCIPFQVGVVFYGVKMRETFFCFLFLFSFFKSSQTSLKVL